MNEEVKKEGIDWSSLWKKDDWLAVWIGFLIIILIIAGVTVKLPKLKWTTGGEFGTYITETLPAVEKLVVSSEEKGEVTLKEAAISLKTAMDTKDRKAIGDAAKKLGEVSKEVKDEGLKKKSGKMGKEISGEAGHLLSRVMAGENIVSAVIIGVILLILSIIAMTLMGETAGNFIKGFPIVFILALVAQFIAGNHTVLYYGLEYVIWCLMLGLFVSNVIGVPEWLKSAVKTEFFIKTGVVVLGSGIFFKEIVKAGFYGIVQAVLVVFVVWYACYWFARKLKVDDEFAAILSSAVSICGVSAAIATSGAIKGDPKKLSYVTSIVLICAVPMLIFQPIIAKAIGMPDVVAGAWLGGTLDTSGSVVAAGSLISEAAMKVGVIVKMSQNVLIGFAAFILSIVWTLKACRVGETKATPSAMEIWYRFPKFVLGFIIASVIFSFLLDPKTVDATKGALGGLRTWWFALAFTSIGLETRFGDLAKLGGGRPAAAFLAAQGFNILWTLVLAYLLFGGIIFPVPDIK
ncbi:MAG: putative sulfate exporter family transporter [Nitrospirae bacterium]|nr:putative sulfate exporter family transporter [Nitrospirota bacterium]